MATKESLAAHAATKSSEECLGIHRGAIDTTTVTTKPPSTVMVGVRKILYDLGLDIQEESSYNYRCVRVKKQDFDGDGANVVDSSNSSQKSGGKQVAYGSPSEDPGDEVRFSVELTRLVGLNNTYSLDIRRLKGNLRSYKFLYETIREKAALGR